MKTIALLLTFSLCSLPLFAEQATVESLAEKIKALERKIKLLEAEIILMKVVKFAEPDNNQRGEIIINILKDGILKVEGQQFSHDELAAKIELILKEFPNQPIRLRADDEIKYQDVVRVIELCQRFGGWNMSFSTTKP
jgi:biopolymer transport protein ExbD